MSAITATRILVFIAAAIFLLAAFGVSFGGIQLIALGLAVWAAAHLIP